MLHRPRHPLAIFRVLEHHFHILRIGTRRFACILVHVLSVMHHPGGTIGLFQIAAGGQWSAAIEYSDSVEAHESSLEDVPTRAVFAIHPPREIQKQLVKAALQPVPISLSSLRL